MLSKSHKYQHRLPSNQSLNHSISLSIKKRRTSSAAAAPMVEAASLVGAAICGLLFLRWLNSILCLLRRLWRWSEERMQSWQSFSIPRYGDDWQENPLYRKAAAYVAALPAAEDSDHTNLFSSAARRNEFSAHLASGQTVHDSFLGARLSWTFLSASAGEGGSLLLRLRRHDRHRVLRPYLQHVENAADEIDLRRKDIRLYSAAGGGSRGERRWRSVALTHPATLETVAMEPELKARVRSDLEAFLKGRGYYARLGRVWKRGYFLHGPPGTGKSSFVAAMAKFLCYDIYEIDLSDSGDLRSLLLKTTPRSVILLEDLDRHLASGGREASAMLNFMDGVFSCCGEERVMVFTASGPGKDNLDSAVVRPGRLDVHIHFPLCDFSAFKTLANSYLRLKDHKLYPQVEEGFQTGAKLSPAEIGEIMIANRGSPSRAIKSVINALHRSASFSERTVNSGFSNGRRGLSESEVVGCGSGGYGSGKDGTVREFRKLYGLIRLRGGSRKEGTMPVEVAEAASVAAEADAGGNSHCGGGNRSG